MTTVKQSEVDTDELVEYCPEADLFDGVYRVDVPLSQDTEFTATFVVAADDPWEALERVRNGYGDVILIDRDSLDYRRADVDEI